MCTNASILTELFTKKPVKKGKEKEYAKHVSIGRDFTTYIIRIKLKKKVAKIYRFRQW